MKGRRLDMTGGAVGVKDDIVQREAGQTIQRLKLWEAPLPKGEDCK